MLCSGRIPDLVKQLNPLTVAQHGNTGRLGSQPRLGRRVIRGRIPVFHPTMRDQNQAVLGQHLP